MLEFVRGATFSIVGSVPIEVSGAAAGDYADWTIESTVTNDARTFTVELGGRWIDTTNGIAELYYTGSTASWPTGVAKIDMKLTRLSDGIVIYAKPTSFLIIKPLTE